MTNFVAHNSRWRVALLILGSGGFAILGLWLAGAFGDASGSRRYSASVAIGIGSSCAVFFGLCAVVGVKKFFDDRVQLEIGPAGILWQQGSNQLIPWSEITDVTTWSHQRQKVILLHLKDPTRFPGLGLAAKLAGANRVLTGGDIAISLTGTDRRYNDAMEAITRFRRGAD